jgi:hypothetical protein
MYMNDYMLLDIITTSKKRKVFFTYYIDMLLPLLNEKDKLFELVY